MSSDALGVGHRLTAAPSELQALTAFDHELKAAPYLWDGMAAADLAHAIALDDAGLIPDDARRGLFEALLASASMSVSDVQLDPHVGDVYNNRDRWLRERAGAAAGHIHAGRARREASTLAWQLACRDLVLELGLAVASLLDGLASVSDAHIETLMPDFTYLHRAQPTTLAHYLLAHAGPIERHLDRVDRTLAGVDASPAGSGSTNGSRLPIRRELLAELLGFSTMIRHTRDAMWASDMVLDLLHLCVQVMTSVDRLAEELQLWTTEAFDFADLSDSQSRTSVVMPHKRNPYSLTYLRGAARHALGVSTGVTATQMTASGQPDNRTVAYLEVPSLLVDTVGAVRLLTEVVTTTTFNTAAMARVAASGFTASTEICDALVLSGAMDNRSAHNLVGRAVRSAVDAGRDHLEMADITTAAASLGLHVDLDESSLARLQDPAEAIASRVTPGGAGREQVVAMIAEHRRAAAQRVASWSAHPSRGYRDRLLDRASRRLTAGDLPNHRSPER